MGQKLEQLLQRCTVKLSIPSKTGWGTGFFVAKTLILTCHHVVKDAKNGKVRVCWQDREDFAEAVLERSLPQFDLALLRFNPPIADLPCVCLDESFQADDSLYTYGYPDDFPQGASVTGKCEGIARDKQPLIKFKAGQVRPGLSGSPLLNQGTGKVCGIVKFTRDRSFDLGGGAVPTREILSQFPELVELQKEFHQQDRRWTDLRSAIDWREICREMLEKRRAFTSNLLEASGNFELEELYVPLGLVEKQPQKKQSEDVSPESGSQVDREENQKEDRKENQKEKIIPIAHDTFFEEVLKQGVSPKSQGRRIAITGEAGSGKTTLLQKIAFWVLEKDLGLPIWIPLSQVETTPSEYLTEVWLPLAKANVTPEIKEDLEKQFREGRVWLLLDGLDERSNPTEQAFINSLQSGWVTKARMVLSSRLNVWEIAQNALNEFDVYRNLDFEPEQVKQFVCNWFTKTEKVASGEQLLQALNESGRERIKDLVRNPLRCSLLCRSWQVGEGNLPDTKAELYNQFVETIYQWKDWSFEPFATRSEAKRELNQALGKLARRAIDEEKSRFVLKHDFVSSELGEPDEPMFRLALKLGWLNIVGKNPENPLQNVYAFYHPTFQEYFAAKAIDDWHFFLNHIPNDPSQGTYRIFEPQWKEPMLLWLGLQDLAKEQKEVFIEALVKFEDGCGEWLSQARVNKGFYEYRAYWLAAAGIAEFGEYSRADEIVKQIVWWGFGYLDEKQKWQRFFDPIAEGAQETLQETERTKAITALVNLLGSTDNESTRWRAAESLGKIGTGSERAIAALIEVLNSSEDEYTCRAAVESLGKIGTGNERAITALVQLLGSSESESIRCQAVSWLGKIGKSNERAITALGQLLDSTEDEYTCWLAADCLEKIDPGNERAITALVQLLGSSEKKRQVAHSLKKIGKGNERAITALGQLLDSTEDEYTCWLAADCLEKIDPGNERAITALVQLLGSTEDGDIRRQAAKSLEEIGKGNERVITALVQLLDSSEDYKTRWQVAQSLGEIDTRNERAIAGLVQLLGSTEDEPTRRQAAESLGTIALGDRKAIAALIKVLGSTEDEYTHWQAADSLGKIDPSNETAITVLLQLTETKYMWRAADSLGKIDPGNERAITVLLQLLDLTKDDWIRSLAVKSLGKIGTGNERAITALLQLLDLTENGWIRSLAVESLGKIGTGNERAITALVQLLGSTEDDGIRWRAADSLEKIDLGNEMAITALVQLLDSGEIYRIRELAANSLKKIDPSNERAITTLVQLLGSSKNYNIRWRVASCLEEIGTGNETAILELVQLLGSSEDYQTRGQVASCLEKIGMGNETAILGLVQLLGSTEDDDIRRQAAESLGKIGIGNETAILELVQLLGSSEDDDIRRQAAESLGKIGTGNETAILELVQLLGSSEDDDIRRQAAFCLKEIGTGNETAILGLVQLLGSTEDDDIRRRAIGSLGTIGMGDERAIPILVQIFRTSENDYTRELAIGNLGKIVTGMVITSLVQLLDSSEDEVVCCLAAYSLGKIDPSNERAITTLVRLLGSSKDKDYHTCDLAAYFLGEIGRGNKRAITALVRLLSSSKDYETCSLAAESLAKIGTGKETVILELVQLLDSSEDDYIRSQAAKSLVPIWMFLNSSEDDWQDYTFRQAAESLGQICSPRNFAEVVTTLKESLNDSQRFNEEYNEEDYFVIWYCAQNMTYPDFYRAWHKDTLTSTVYPRSHG
ncbi:MAG: HEAT repeat domain-containing protein [Spirulina sp.]